MARDLILAIDAGTSVIKVLAFDLDGNEVATAARLAMAVWVIVLSLV